MEFIGISTVKVGDKFADPATPGRRVNVVALGSRFNGGRFGYAQIQNTHGANVGRAVWIKSRVLVSRFRKLEG